MFFKLKIPNKLCFALNLEFPWKMFHFHFSGWWFQQIEKHLLLKIKIFLTWQNQSSNKFFLYILGCKEILCHFNLFKQIKWTNSKNLSFKVKILKKMYFSSWLFYIFNKKFIFKHSNLWNPQKESNLCALLDFKII